MNLGFFEEFIDEQEKAKLIKTKYPNAKGDVMVCCPFPHKKSTVDANWNPVEVEYKEMVPSAGINLDKRVFNCLVCGEGHNELSFAKKVTGKTEAELIKDYSINEEFKSETESWRELQHKTLLANTEMLEKLHDLKISDSIIHQLKLGYITEMVAIPCFKKGKIVDIARYNINKKINTPKVLRNPNSVSGNIIPFDVWVEDKTPTIVCEGEKDMLVARSHGFNAISITGGAQYGNMQNEFLPYFKDRLVYIVYDNDEAGKEGALKLYKVLSKYTNNVFITDISAICVENKEDVADFFIKYDKGVDDFKKLVENNSTKPTDTVLQSVKVKGEIKLTKISDNIQNSLMKKTLKSRFQIVATCSDIYSVPEYAEFRPLKTEESKNDEDTELKKPKFWHLSENLGNFLEFIEMGAKQKDMMRTFARLMGVKTTKDGTPIGYSFEPLGKLKNIYKMTVADEVIENDDYVSEVSVDMYTFEPLEIGNNYEIEYKLYPHPKDGQRVIAVATKINKTEDDIENMSDDFINSLNQFKVKYTVESKINELYISARNHIAPYLNKTLWLMCDLVFNSPLDFTYIKPLRGALDVFVLGDTRTGKSETSRALRELYDFGSVVPLKTATTQSLIGGTSDRDKKTKLGILPREHKGLVILEEFSGAPMGFMKTMTEIRSSSIIKLYRVNSGELKAPCKLRMITISNPTSNDDGFPRLLSIFPNGVEPIIELVNSPEDIARYDAFMLVPRVTERMNPFNDIEESITIDKKHYENKVKWVRSLKASDVVISNEVGKYIFDKSVQLNDLFESNFTLFGAETDKKLARFSCALATLLVSTDEENRKVIITKEHVDYIYNFFISVYDNEHFRLKNYATEQKEYSVVTATDIDALQTMYSKNTTIIDLLSNKSKTNRNEMQVSSGQDREQFGKVFNQLVARKFVKMSHDQVMPTEKFRMTYKVINKSFTLNDVSNIKEAKEDMPF